MLINTGEDNVFTAKTTILVSISKTIKAIDLKMNSTLKKYKILKNNSNNRLKC